MSQSYNLCDIALNNGTMGRPIWIIIKGAVYDVTKFAQEHPGGEDILKEYAGKDATKAFNDVGHSMDAIKDLKLYKIGQVSNECAQKSADVEDFVAGVQCCRQPKKRLKFFFCF